MTAPNLKRHEGSWVVTNKIDGRVFEITDKESATSAAISGKWTVETIGDYLARINERAKQ